MPNIEIHGLHLRRASLLKKDVFDLFKDKPYVKEMVITTYQTTVEDIDHKDQPFFRLINDSKKPQIAAEIKCLLHENFTNMDIEHILNNHFIPKKDSS